VSGKWWRLKEKQEANGTDRTIGQFNHTIINPMQGVKPIGSG